jgi:hypothetical protein
MARLPQSIDMQGPRGATARGTTLDFDGLDNALQGVAREVSRFDQTRKAVDDEEAERILARVQADYSAGAAERWATYDGRELGRDAAETAEWNARLAPVLDDPELPDGVRDSLRRRGRDLTVRIAGQATAAQAQARAQRVAADRDNNERSAASMVVQTAMSRWHPRMEALRKDWDPSTDLTQTVMPEWDAFVEQELAPHPPAVQQRVREAMMVQRGQMQANLLAGQDQARDQVTRTNVTAATTALLNRIQRQPSLFGQFDAQIREIASSLDRSVQDQFINEQRERAAALHLQGRIDEGGLDDVEADLESGRFDYLPPAVIGTARERVEVARNAMTVEKALAQAALTEQFQANLYDISRGEAPDMSLLAEAGELFGPERVAEMLLEQQAAARLQPVMEGLFQMSPAEGAARLEGLERAAATEAERRALGPVREAVQRDLGMRASDPATWAITPVGPGDRVRSQIRVAFDTLIANPTPDLAQKFATASLLAQREGGIAETQRRILPSQTAKDLVAGLEQPGADATANLRSLRAFVGNFGPYAPRVMVDLAEAGLTNRALGAIMHYADQPQMLGRYAAGLGTPAPARAADVRKAIEEGTAEYGRTLATGEGLAATRAAAMTVANALVAQGETPEEAARIALRPITGQHEYGSTFAIPKSAGVNPRRWEREANEYLGTLTSGDMAQLQMPRVPGYTPEQNRRVMRDRIESGRWVTNPQETGAVFMVETFDADENPTGPRPLATRDGTPIERAWTARRVEGQGLLGRLGLD